MAFQLYIEDELLITMKVAFNVDDAFQNCLAFYSEVSLSVSGC